MDLEILRNYFSFLAGAEADLKEHRSLLEGHSAFAFYRLIAQRSQPAIDQTLITAFVRSFTYNFQPARLEQLLDRPNFSLFPQD